MYVPEAFREDRIEVLHAMMRELGAATIVGLAADGLMATHVPVVLDLEPAPFGTVCCHFSRANPHAAALVDGGELLLIFQGPQGYVSPSWCATKEETGKVLPTWDYVAVHAYGQPTLFDGAERLRPHLAALTSQFEEEFDLPWGIEDAPADFVDAMYKGIVGVEIPLSRLEGKWKLSQNRPEKDQLGVIRGLRGLGDEASRKLADLVESAG